MAAEKATGVFVAHTGRLLGGAVGAKGVAGSTGGSAARLNRMPTILKWIYMAKSGRDRLCCPLLADALRAP